MKQILKKIFLVILPFIVIILLYAVKYVYDKKIGHYGIPCIFKAVTGKYCMGCGGTRSFYALLECDIVSSIRNNPIVVLFAGIGIGFYIEKVIKIFWGYEKKIVPRSDIFIYVTLGAMLLFYILRNIFPILAPL